MIKPDKTIRRVNPKVRELVEKTVLDRNENNIDNSKSGVWCYDVEDCYNSMEEKQFNLIIFDPRYLKPCKFFSGEEHFGKVSCEDYASWFEKHIKQLFRLLAKKGTLYVFSDWLTSIIIGPILQNYLDVQCRLTWGRGTKQRRLETWRDEVDDIWHCTKWGSSFKEPKAVKKINELRYKISGISNFLNVTKSFWNMKENTTHKAQKPEALYAMLITASSNKGDRVFAPMAGSGTALSVCTKLGRDCIEVEKSFKWACISEYRKMLAMEDSKIVGYDQETELFGKPGDLKDYKTYKNLLKGK